MWAPGKVLEDATGLSFYEIVDTLAGGYALHGLLSFMRKWSLHAALKTELAESRTTAPELLLDSELLPTTEADKAYSAALQDRVGAPVTVKPIRLSFFAYPYREHMTVDLVPEEALLGTAVVNMIAWPGHELSVVSDCVVRCPSLLNNYVHLRREFAREIRGRTFSIRGTYFCQQDGLLGVCAHAAARMYLGNHPRGPEHPPSCQQINKDILNLSSDRIRRLGTDAEGGGLTASELVQVLKSFGLNAFIHDYSDEPERDYAADVYSAVESQAPALLAFRTNRAHHVVTVVGHTLNTDLWLPQVQLEYFEEEDGLHHHDSHMWVEDYIVHDDNFGMLQSLPAHCLESSPVASTGTEKLALGMLGISGKALACISDKYGNVDGKNAETLALDILYGVVPLLSASGEQAQWFRRLKDAVTTLRKGPVLRTFQASKADYVGHLHLIRDRHGVALEPPVIELAENSLPDRFWITEFTLPDLYTANKNKLGEVLCSAEEAGAPEPSGGTPRFLLLRLPGSLTAAGPVSLPTDLRGHVRILHRPIANLQW